MCWNALKNEFCWKKIVQEKFYTLFLFCLRFFNTILKFFGGKKAFGPFQVIFDPPQTPSRPGNGGPDAAVDALSIATSLGVIGQGVKKKSWNFRKRT